jgi:hypothetical protein
MYGTEHDCRDYQLCSHSIVSMYVVEREDSLPNSLELSNCPYPEPHQSSPHHPHSISTQSSLMLSAHVRLGLPSVLFPTDFPTNKLYTFLFSPIRATCPAHLILLDMITLMILGEEYKSHISSLCSFLHSPITPSSRLWENKYWECELGSSWVLQAV